VTQFNTIDALLDAVSTDIERVRILASSSQDSAAGIVDYPDVSATDSDKAYWEGDYQVLDAVVAIYDLISGRDSNFATSYVDLIHTDPSDGVCIGASASHESGNVLTVVGDSYIDDIDAANITLRATGEVTAPYGIFDYLIISYDAGIDQGVGIEEGYVTDKIGQTALLVEEEDGDCKFHRPWANANYEAMGSYVGGFLWQAAEVNVMSITNAGHLWLGQYYPANTTPPSMTIQNSDATTNDIYFRGYCGEDTSSDFFRTRIRCDYDYGVEVEIALKAYNTGSGTDRISFLFDSVEKAYIDANGNFDCTLELSCATLAVVATITAVTATLSGNLACVDALASGDVQCVELVALNDVYAGNYASESFVRLSDGSGTPYLLLSNTGDEEAKIVMDTSAALSKIVVETDYGLVIDTDSASQRMLYIRDESNYRAGIQMGNTYESDYLFCQDGVIRTTSSIGSGTNAFGESDNIGAHKAPSGSAASWIALGSIIDEISDDEEGAVFIGYETTGSTYRIYVYIDGGWRYAALS